jgi:hypothetical protein
VIVVVVMTLTAIMAMFWMCLSNHVEMFYFAFRQKRQSEHFFSREPLVWVLTQASRDKRAKL